MVNRRGFFTRLAALFIGFRARPLAKTSVPGTLSTEEIRAAVRMLEKEKLNTLCASNYMFYRYTQPFLSDEEVVLQCPSAE